MIKIPKIIHQIWGGEKKLPEHFQILSETWKNDYPNWKYEFWDDKRINDFVLNNYPEYYKQFIEFPYDMQRWDAVRYFILDKIGGMHVDFDYESILSIEPLIKNKECCFALDPISHRSKEEQEFMLNGALMLSTPDHWFMKKIIQTIFSKKNRLNNKPKDIEIFTSAGPWMLIDLYNSLNQKEKEEIFLISDKLVSPFDCRESQKYLRGEMSDKELQSKIKKAYAVHYFFGDWR